MTDVPAALTAEQVSAKWAAIAPLIDKLNDRTDDKDDFDVHPRSSLARDDEWADPYHVSHAVKACIVAGVDHLHAVKVLIVDAQTVHVAAPASLVRGCLENISAAYWILHPASRAERVTRCLRWHMQNAKDQHKAIHRLALPDYKPQDERIAKIVAVAERHRGIDVKSVERGYSSTAVVTYADKHVDSRLGVLTPWQLCSGFAHGRPWANLSFSEREEHPTSDPNVMVVRFSTDLTRALYLVRAAMNLTQDLLQMHQQRSRPQY
ncbi:hypothetical protein [Isoptericola rhizosphaerae]|uniref:hypothetical protein n=1 Tax=Isoptericola rhizosphaerae TaxID=3377837 RepID=UPI00383B9874